jgi:hypothetical protein
MVWWHRDRYIESRKLEIQQYVDSRTMGIYLRMRYCCRAKPCVIGGKKKRIGKNRVVESQKIAVESRFLEKRDRCGTGYMLTGDAS